MTSDRYNDLREKPLDHIRVLDLATFVAAPFCGSLLGEFGAEVIKVELPVFGDPCREVGIKYNDVGLMWAQENRNKMGVTCDLRRIEGQAIIKELVGLSDIVLENFRPGTMTKWNLGYHQLEEINPKIIMVSVSAYGQTGPYKHKTGFGRVAQAFGGLTYLAGFPDQPPVNPGSATLADYSAGLFAAYSTMVALEYRNKTGKGQWIDISLYESIFRLLDSLAPTYDKFGIVRERIGTGTANAVPHNHYPTKDGKWVAIACTSDRIFFRLLSVMQQEHISMEPHFRTGQARLENREEVDALVSAWTLTRSMGEIMELLDGNGVPASPINSIEDIFQDPQFIARKSIVEVDDPVVGIVKTPGIVPRLSRSPGTVKTLGPRLGQHNQAVYSEILGYTQDHIKDLVAKGII